MMFLDYTYILVIIGMLISMLASLRVKSTFKKFDTIKNSRGMTAQDAAKEILANAGINDVVIQRVGGELTDHYSPKDKVLRLSDSVYDNTSVAAIGVAAHECGHAIQHQEGYGPLALRSASVPIANFGSKLSIPIVFVGLLLGFTELAQVGVILFTFVVLFQLITLPVEFNASRRALVVLENRGLLGTTELSGAKKVLSAAALTYVAALLSSILQLLRLVLLTQGGRRRK